MPLIAIPNISTAAGEELDRAVQAVTGTGTRLIDVHSDRVHNRTVLTCAAPSPAVLQQAMVHLARACRVIDLTRHRGVHPRLGALDVCPFVPHDSAMEEAVTAARATAARIGSEAGLPVYLYGAAALRQQTRDLPDLRRGGLERLAVRAARDLPPDAGPVTIDRRIGVACVGARQPLVAFNVWIAASAIEAQTIASEVREPGAVRALGLQIDEGRAQVSMNLVDPARRGIDDVFQKIESRATRLGVELIGTEIVGVPPARFMPRADAAAARLLIEPGRSLETALAG
ncbi:MAG TPA: glutamate formiminotransferase [Actinomycetota bacterium]|nr:glutamate formiminotransferase [Actinomycetota bacterium]